ncbi:MAG: hypothetical protein ACR2PH_15685 [Desulfobulbia bacterium]
MKKVTKILEGPHKGKYTTGSIIMDKEYAEARGYIIKPAAKKAAKSRSKK